MEYKIGDILIGKHESKQHYSITTNESLVEIVSFYTETIFTGKLLATKQKCYIDKIGNAYADLNVNLFKLPSLAECDDIFNTCNQLQAKYRLR